MYLGFAVSLAYTALQWGLEFMAGWLVHWTVYSAASGLTPGHGRVEISFSSLNRCKYLSVPVSPSCALCTLCLVHVKDPIASFLFVI